MVVNGTLMNDHPEEILIIKLGQHSSISLSAAIGKEDLENQVDCTLIIIRSK